MANTYTQIYIQFVFAVKNRLSLIQPHWKDDLCKYITGIVQKNGHKLLAVNGPANHLHVFVGYKPNQKISNLLQDIKGCSSKWINEQHLVQGRFQWQEGYGAFSYSHSHINTVIQYITKQEEHHRVKSFKEEYLEFLEKFNIQYNSQYLLVDI